MLPNPVGYNRVYVHVDGELNYDRWFEALRAGRSFVTNGPLLRVRADSQYPGHIFTAPEKLEIELTGILEGRDHVESLEVIRDGRVIRKVPAAEFARTGTLGKVTFTSSGWLLVRAIADNPQTFRFASTAPWYVEVGAVKRRVARSSARFFRDWTEERIERLKVSDPIKKAEVLELHLRARDYWAALVDKANAN